MKPSLLATLLLLSFVAPTARAEEAGEDIVGPFPWTVDADTFFLRRIVDGATGLPIAGARVKLFSEVPHPVPGFGTPTAVGESGPDGWVRIRRSALCADLVRAYGEPDWAYAEAEGYGPDGEMDRSVGGDWELGPAAEVRVSVRDPLDRPVVGAHVGWMLGCGHTPDVRQAFTDAQGVARLMGLNPANGRGWLVQPGLETRYTDDGTWTAWRREQVLRAGWGGVFEGRVVTATGAPAVGAAVGTESCHRGPWAHADASGRFQLLSPWGGPRGWHEVTLSPDAHVLGRLAAQAGERRVHLAPPGFQRVLTLLPPEAEEVEEAAGVRLVVEVEWPEEVGKDELPTTVTAVRLEDGWTTDGDVGEQRVALLDVLPGRYRVIAQAFTHAFPSVRAEGDVEAPAVGGTYTRLALPAPRLVLPRLDLEHASIDLLSETDHVAFNYASLTFPFRLHLDPTRRHWMRIGGDEGTLLLPVPPPTDGDGDDRLELPVPRLAQVQARLVDPEGRPVAGWLLYESDLGGDRSPKYPDRPPETDASQRPSVQAREGEDLDLVVWPHDALRLQPVRVPRLRPTAAAGPIDLGDVRLPPRGPTLTVLGSDGKPHPDFLERHGVRVTRGERQDELHLTLPDRTSLLDAWDEPGLLGPGAIVRAYGGGDTTTLGREDMPWSWHTRLHGAGPWTVTPPTGVLELDVLDASGRPIERSTVRLDGDAYEPKTSALRFLHLAPGPHEVVVEAEGMQARRLRLTLADRETRRWTARLAPTRSR